MILSSIEIRSYLNHNNPLIENFKESSLQSESYDLSIGATISKYDSDFKILDLKEQKEIDKAYITDVISNKGYLIGPKEYVLVSIDEKINMPDNLTAHIRPRTKFTRIGLIISSQHCNSSYCGKLSLGLYNVNPFAIRIYPGMRIAQIVFEELFSVPPKNKQYNGKYQNESKPMGADFSSEKIKSNTTSDSNIDQNFYNFLLDQLEKG